MNSLISRLKNKDGAVLLLVVVFMIALIGIIALAIDVGHLFVVRNQLQNAADAGALRGARVLYNDYGTAINEGANQAAYDAATQNKALAQGGSAIAVDIDLSAGDIQRGHWSFATKTFTPNNSLAVVDLWGVSTAALDANTDFINAVRVVANRNATPAASFFARPFGLLISLIKGGPPPFQSFELSAEAVGYIGFAGTLTPESVDQPIAICEDSILNPDDEYSCNVGRMINSGQNTGTNETGGWTDFNQDNPCNGGTNSNDVKEVVCGNGNTDTIFLGGAVATNGGAIQTAFDKLEGCWPDHSSNKTEPWNMTLPVVRCGDGNIGVCEEVVGAVNLNLIWILRDENKVDDDAPTIMKNPKYDPDNEGNGPPYWEADQVNGEYVDGITRWNDFVSFFNLRTSDGQLAEYEFTTDDGKTASGFTKKTIYFLPDCTPHELKGLTGGQNFGVLAEIPVLVQ